MLGVHVEAGPSTQEIISAFERCEGWSRDDRKRLAYLAIFPGYIEGRRYSTPTRVSLARLVTELERFENYPWGRVAFKVLMDSVKGRDILSCYTINGFAQALQTRVINFVQKDIGEMFPKWEFDVEDTPAENIIKLMFVKKPWKWTMDCWEVTGTWVNTKPAVVSPAKKKVVKEDSPRPRKKARKEAPAEASEEAAAEATLHDDEYEELKESKLGVFIKFQELGFDWASRLVHYMLGFQLDIKKKYELWSLVGPEPVRFSLLEFENLTGLNCEYIEDLERPHSVVTKEFTSFWEMLGVHVEAGPSTQEIIAALERCEGWSQDDRKRLAYLAIFTGYIEGRKYSTPTRVSLPRRVMELERFENYPWGRVAFKVLMDSMKGRDISGCYTINGFAQTLQTRVINFVQKDIGQMFPKWVFDVEDTLAENIIKLMFVKKPWKWTMDCWEVTGTWVNTKPAVVSSAKKKGSEGRPRKKARKEAPAEASEEAAAEASEGAAAEASEEVTTTVGGLTKEDIKTMFKDIADAMREGFGTCLKEIKYLSERVEAVEKKVGITTKRKGTSSQNTTSPPKPTLEPGHIDAWINVLRKRYDANPQHFRSERMCFLDHLFAQQWRFNYKDFKDSEPDQNGLGRRLPGGAWNYYAGTTPSFCQSNKVWGMDIDDVYAPVNYNDTHWITMWISIPKRHIVVWDNICSSISPEDLDVVMEPFLYMVPYLLVECTSSDEQRAQYSLEPFTYERPTNIPPARAGDCGVYTLKYIKCHALGI
ncbi:hypothetical protein F2Q69_00008692 [Brassica cretica]|uniref:Ubiquitin-like protease family profile domain-containing protein n=1 Tax=Brassica cretica TaxID=69181 RepID=A0A8S9NSS1_BRACR|nr:hypothetical protein F2Q69_00008692 [Brassica cretica]